jgi:hypothetical protein
MLRRQCLLTISAGLKTFNLLSRLKCGFPWKSHAYPCFQCTRRGQILPYNRTTIRHIIIQLLCNFYLPGW